MKLSLGADGGRQGVVDLPPILRQAVKTHNPLNEGVPALVEG